ncbi:MAG: hypothetical protein NC115_10950 [Bacteroidales bacterium]|nr:hypothetical protein [Bacteroidales bacterium]
MKIVRIVVLWNILFAIPLYAQSHLLDSNEYKPVYAQSAYRFSYHDNFSKVDYIKIRDILKHSDLKVNGKRVGISDLYGTPIKDFMDLYGNPDKVSALYYVYKLHEYWCLPSVFSYLSDMEIPIKIYYWEEKKLTVFCVPKNYWFRYPETLSSIRSNCFSEEFEKWLACDSGDEQWQIILWKKGDFDLKMYKSFGILHYSNPFYDYSPEEVAHDMPAPELPDNCPDVFKTFTRNNFFDFYASLPSIWLSDRKYSLNDLYGLSYPEITEKFGYPEYYETYLFCSGISLPRVTWPVEELLSNYDGKIIPLRISRYYGKVYEYTDFWFVRNGDDFLYDAYYHDPDFEIMTNENNRHKDYLKWLANDSDDKGWSLIYVDTYFYESDPFHSMSVEQ